MNLGWQDVRDEALRRIRSRAWAPGALIPNEADLAQELGCARATVNRALRALAEEGWLDRRRKAGTRVALAPQRRAQLAIPLIRRQIEARGQRFTHRILARSSEGMPSHVLALLGLAAPGPQAMHVRTLYCADGTAFALEDRWVNLAMVPEIATADLDAHDPNEWLVRNAPFAHGILDCSAAPASAQEAVQLGCAPDAPLMILERRTYGPGAPVTYVRMAHAPGHRIRLEI